MKKRFMSLLLVLVMVFSLLPISAMAQVYIFEGDAIQVEFYKSSESETPFNTQRVLTNGTDSIYDPGCELEENTVFLGWQVNGQGETMNIADVRAFVAASVSAGETVKLVASVSPVRYLVYNDESGRVVKTVAVILARNSNSWATDVDYDYTPVNVNSDFFGWKTSQTGTDVEYENKSVGDEATHPTSITLSESTTNLYPVCKSGYWVTFNENDKPYDSDTGKGNRDLNENIHATYQPPVFVLDGETLNPNSGKYPVSAQGYEFVEWCDENGNSVTNVTEATTVYAKWNPTQVKYKVAYWQQNANKDENGEYGYSVVANSIYDMTGTAGEFATYDKDRARDQYTSEHFKLNETKSDNEKVVIAGDGSAVKNVYFDRDQFTLTFLRPAQNSDKNTVATVTIPRDCYLYVVGEDNTITGDKRNFAEGSIVLASELGKYAYYDTDDEKYYYAFDSDNNRFYYNYTDWRGRETYDYTSAGKSVLVKEITAKYGEHIGDEFPITGNGASDEWRWSPVNSDVFSNVLVYIDTMPAENMVFERNTSNATLKYIQFFVEPLPGETGTEPHDGKTYVAYHDPIKAKYNFFTEAEDYVNLYGFEHDGSDPAFSNGRADVSSGGTLKLYYKRNVHTLSFNTGDSVKPADVTVKYDVPMASYNPGYVIGETTRDRNGRPIIFQGWYDNAAYAGSPYDFSAKRMPDSDVLLYAKWADARYAVQLQLDGGQMPEGSQTEFKVSYNGKIDITNNPTKAGFEFAGWYTDPACTQRFNLDTQLNEKTVKDAYTDPKDSTVMGKLTLYAKWRPEMDADTYILVKYDADGGTVNGAATYDDPLHYAAAAEAVAQPAAAPASDEAGKSFRAWQILNAADEVVGEVLPGNIFNVNLADAEETTVDGKTVYVVTLKADYAVATSTHIVWYGNGGTTANGAETVESADANLNAAIQVKPADTFTREGYVFLGWARLNETDENGVKNPEVVDAKGNFINQNLAEADLWLTWDGEKYTAVNKAGETVTNPDIAANDIKPFHVLYAVWEKITPNTYVIDFSSKMTVANETSKMEGADAEGVLQGKNGKFKLASEQVTYQLDTQTQHTNAGGTTVINKAYSSADSAVIYGKPVGENTKNGWNKITTIPAGSVYFDDDLAEKTVTVGDGSGYNAEISATSPDVINMEKNTYTFTFYGTGIDVYCTTYKMETGGYVQGKVDGNNEKTQTIRNLSETTRYNVPTISFRDLGQGEHTLVINVLGSSGYKLDGIRVYNPVDNGTYDGQGTHEQYAAYINMREALVNDHGVSQAFTDNMTDTVLGALFVDDSSKMAQKIDNTTGLPATEESDPAHIAIAYTSQFEAYKANSPEHEIYLDSTKQQEIIFKLTENGVDAAENGNLWIGLSAPDATANGGTVQYKQDVTQNVTNAVDMYYPITREMITVNQDGTGNVAIKNIGSSMISVTNLKITGNQTIYNAVQAAQPANSEDAAPASLADAMPLVFEPLTMQSVKIAANNGVDPDAPADPGTVDPEDPGTPDQPDDPKPGWNDSAYNPMNILKTLFQSLLNGLGNLFKGLGGW